VLLFLFALTPSGAAIAHPHAWIDLRVSLVFGSSQALPTMRQEWVFDPSYSHLLLEEIDLREPGLSLQEALQRVGTRLMDNLRSYDYFTEFVVGSERLAVPDASAPELVWQGQRLILRFELPLADATAGVEPVFSYRVYDPSYWIEVLHDPNDVIHLERGEHCEYRLQTPRPEPWLVAYAATLNRDQRAPIENLGSRFAETVLIRCSQ
jgi:ABC-type uncharacterized transport system substrate-binding protein